MQFQNDPIQPHRKSMQPQLSTIGNATPHACLNAAQFSQIPTQYNPITTYATAPQPMQPHHSPCNPNTTQVNPSQHKVTSSHSCHNPAQLNPLLTKVNPATAHCNPILPHLNPMQFALSKCNLSKCNLITTGSTPPQSIATNVTTHTARCNSTAFPEYGIPDPHAVICAATPPAKAPVFEFELCFCDVV